jgi:hypothetical protein
LDARRFTGGPAASPDAALPFQRPYDDAASPAWPQWSPCDDDDASPAWLRRSPCDDDDASPASLRRQPYDDAAWPASPHQSPCDDDAGPSSSLQSSCDDGAWPAWLRRPCDADVPASVPSTYVRSGAWRLSAVSPVSVLFSSLISVLCVFSPEARSPPFFGIIAA